ncbi:MAG TPA: sigma-70 family RNA polymerase sigma factor [Solirubrobacteraceae bacterium]|nr:sigma-70 family RNA polymerase sigma factor [Solirubrobacteraceae bacterium]
MNRQGSWGSGEQALLGAARGGDEDAFGRLVQSHRGKLHAHCYRMLGSVHDADDALQETLLRAWRGLPWFDGRSALSSWLYRIATNACLNAIKKRPKRVLPIDYGHRSADPHDAAAEPLVESVWIEPYPDELLASDDRAEGPAARYEQRESLELAFVAALQHLPANQRAALIMSEVLGFSAREVADSLETSTASVNSALQRARKLVDERLPEQSQQATLRALGDERLNAVVEGYMQAMDRADVGALVTMLSEDASWSMPPQPAWFRGHEDIVGFLTENPFKYFRWRHMPTGANGQPAVGSYSWAEERGSYVAHSLNVLTLRGPKIAEVISFLDVTRRGVDGPGFTRFLEDRVFERFGLPNELPA